MPPTHHAGEKPFHRGAAGARAPELLLQSCQVVGSCQLGACLLCTAAEFCRAGAAGSSVTTFICLWVVLVCPAYNACQCQIKLIWKNPTALRAT